MTVHIFGDSFAAGYPDNKFMGQSGKCWHDLLNEEMNESIENYAESGTGPYDAFEIFYEKHEKNLIKGKTYEPYQDKIIFVLSCQYRLPIDNPSLPTKNNQSVCLDVLQGLKNTVLDSLEYEIFYTHEILKEEIFRANIKNIYFLKTLSQLEKIKIMVFLGFEFNTEKVHEHVDVVKKYKLKNLNDDYFRISLKPLFQVSLEESIYEKDYDDSINYRPNHLSFCNHRILTNKVLNFFNNDNLEEEWCKGFLTTWNNSSTKKFVYE